MQAWLLVRGRGDKPLDRFVDTAAIRAHSSSKRPSVALGVAVPDPAAGGRPRPARGSGGRGGRRIPAERLAAFTHPIDPRAVRDGSGSNRSGRVGSRAVEIGKVGVV